MGESVPEEQRRFVLAPMAELAPSLMHPKLNQSISEMLSSLKTPRRGHPGARGFAVSPSPKRPGPVR
jgi:hypothetical protein